jgi:hypothetical protein
MDNGYDQQPLGRGRVRFIVQPAIVRPPRLVPLLVLTLTAAGALLLPPEPSGLPGWFARGFAGLALGRLVAVIVRDALMGHLRRLRSPGGEFVVSPRGLELPGGAAVSREPALANRLASSGPRSARMISYALCCRTKDGLVTLAGGMSEAVALALLREVRRILEGHASKRVIR